MNQYEILDETLDYLNEGKFLDKMKKLFSKKKKGTTSTKIEYICTEEEYNEFIKKDAEKIYKEYINDVKKTMKEFKDSEKFIHVRETLDNEVKEAIYTFGETYIYYIDYGDYARVNNMTKNEALEILDEEFMYKFGDAVKKNIKSKIDGVRLEDFCVGDYDEFYAAIEFSKEFFNSRIKKQ